MDGRTVGPLLLLPPTQGKKCFAKCFPSSGSASFFLVGYLWPFSALNGRMSTEISNSHGYFVRLYGIFRGIFDINKGVTPYVTAFAD